MYERNALFFTLALVLEPRVADAPSGGLEASAWSRCSAADYGEVLRRACVYLVALERKARLVSGHGSRDELRHMLPALLHGLQTEGGVTLALDAALSTRLQLPRPVREACRVQLVFDFKHIHRRPDTYLGSTTISPRGGDTLTLNP